MVLKYSSIIEQPYMFVTNKPTANSNAKMRFQKRCSFIETMDENMYIAITIMEQGQCNSRLVVTFNVMIMYPTSFFLDFPAKCIDVRR